MKKYLLFASWFALNCYAAEHARAWTMFKSNAPSELVANSEGSSEVLNFTTPQTSFTVYWENIRPNDVLTFNDWPTTFYGSVAEDVLHADSGYLSISSLLPFTQVTFAPNVSDPGAYFNPSFASFDLAQPGGPGDPLEVSFATERNAAATPEASTLVMLTLGLGLLALPKLAKARGK